MRFVGSCLSLALNPLFFAGLLAASVSDVVAQAYGLTERPTVAPYLDGVMPPQPPALGTDWSTALAFPNLTFLNPMGIVQMPGQETMAVWEREGRIYTFSKHSSTSAKTLIADLSANCQGWDDSGLMGIAFHPRFDLGGAPGSNRYLFVWYTWTATVQGNANQRPPTNKAVRDRLARLTLDANGVMVPGSETIFIDQNGGSVWHNGGGMFFHPGNGFLYITNGDDANTGNSQQITGGLFSGVIRIDVDRRGGAISHAPPRTPTNATTANYYIPNDNPFVGVTNANEEMFALGLRSPHRMTLDPVTGRIFVGDVGAGSREEVTVIEPNDPPGANLQWSRIEGFGGELTAPFVGSSKPPIIDYGRSEGAAVIGGYVYRGTEFAAELGGRYLFGDNISNRIWVLDESTAPATKVLLTSLPKGPGPNAGNDYVGLSSFGVDAEGEIYLCQLSSTAGKIYRLQRGGTPSQPLPPTLSATGVFSDTEALVPSAKLIPYGLNQPFWSDNAVKSRWAAVPDTSTIGFAATGEWIWPEGSVLVKHFELPVDDTNPALLRRLETRLLVKMAGGSVYGATYKWRADQSDADLLDSPLTENVAVAIAPPGALVSQDIGGPALSGSMTRDGDAITIAASGADIWGTADQFHFAHQPRTGDFDVWVRIESLSQADLYSKAGLMARESLAAGSRHVFALAFPSNAARNNNDGGFEFQYRPSTSGASLALYPAQPQPRVNYPNTWLRLRREGDTFIAFSSLDGVWWDEFAAYTLDLPDTLYFGIAVTAHTNGARATSRVHLQSTRRQPWYYPGRNDCVTCHNTPAGGVLGPKTRQLNGEFPYPGGTTDNQLRAWAHVGLFDNPPAEAEIGGLAKLAALDEAGATVEHRARSYLDSNCASCHRSGGVQAFWDARYDTPLAEQGILYGPVVNNLGTPGARVVVPQDLLRSILHQRVNTVGPNQMPPLARNTIDQEGADLLAEWIASLPPNTPPEVALTSPLDGAAFLESDPIQLSATASDADGIQKVEFYADATKLGEDTTEPYAFAWSGATRGDHRVRAIAVDSVGNSNASDSALIHVQNTPLPSPWIHQDVGAVALAGDAGFNAGTFTLSGGGSDIWGTADGFHFAYQPMTGDGELRARVVSLENTDGWAKAGVMIRESTGAGSRHAFSMVSASNGAGLQRRVNTDGISTHTGGAGAAPYWVRLVRAGNTFTAYASANGTNWTEVGSDQIAMASTVLAGLAVTAHNNAVLADAVFTDVSVNGSTTTSFPPVVTLAQPNPGAVFYNPGAINLAAEATDGDGTVSHVEFLVDGVQIGDDFSEPYTATWSAPTYGTHIVVARAFDAEGTAGESAPAVITVNIPGTPGFRAEYHDAINFTDLAFVRADGNVNFDWGGGSPDPRMGTDTFSVRWSGRIRPRFTQTYTLTTESDDGVRLWLDGQPIIDEWIDQAPTRASATIPLVADQEYDVIMEYYENGGGAVARLLWSSPSQTEEPIPSSRVTVPPPMNASPFVALTAPVPGSVALPQDTITLVGDASDPDGNVVRVEFWVDGVKLGEDTEPPFTWDWAGPHPAGAHSVFATAVDNGGATAVSAPTTVQIVPFELQVTDFARLSNPERISVTLRVSLPPGLGFVFEESGDLQDWRPIRTGVSGNLPVEATAIAPADGTMRSFYRLRLTD